MRFGAGGALADGAKGSMRKKLLPRRRGTSCGFGCLSSWIIYSSRRGGDGNPAIMDAIRDGPRLTVMVEVRSLLDWIMLAECDKRMKRLIPAPILAELAVGDGFASYSDASYNGCGVTIGF